MLTELFSEYIESTRRSNLKLELPQRSDISSGILDDLYNTHFRRLFRDLIKCMIFIFGIRDNNSCMRFERDRSILFQLRAAILLSMILHCTGRILFSTIRDDLKVNLW